MAEWKSLSTLICEYTEAQQYQRISDTLTMLTTGGERK